MTARVSIQESTLRAIRWALIEGHDVDGNALWMVEGTHPNGGHAFFLSIPVDEVVRPDVGEITVVEYEGEQVTHG